MKYIIINSLGIETAILFPDHVQHLHAVNLLQVKPLSAGFCSVKDGRVICWGVSDSLKLGCRPQRDLAAISTSLFMMGLIPATAVSLSGKVGLVTPCEPSPKTLEPA